MKRLVRFSWSYQFSARVGLPVTLDGVLVGRVVEVGDGWIRARIDDRDELFETSFDELSWYAIKETPE